MKTYTIYGGTQRGPFSTRTIDYANRTHPYVITVRAKSIKHAYYLAGQGIESNDTKQPGVTNVE